MWKSYAPDIPSLAVASGFIFAFAWVFQPSFAVLQAVGAVTTVVGVWVACERRDRAVGRR